MEWLLIFGMMLVTFIPRYLPFAWVDKLSLPQWFLQTLPYVPIAVLTAIIAQNTFFIEGDLVFALDNTRLLTGIVAVIVAILTRSLWWTLGIGMVIFVFLNQFL